jgi:uncharacterized protein (DUF1684 family)
MQFMKHFLLLVTVIFSTCTINAQSQNYNDSLQQFRNNYIETHEVVKGEKRKAFRFFPINEKYRIVTRFEVVQDSIGFMMPTSGKKTSRYFVAGKLQFKLNNRSFTLTVYKSEQLMSIKEYEHYLFVPYTDLTSGEKSYGGGKYLEFYTTDIINNQVVIDFNKAYNPYCAYASGFNCPIPPRENDLPIAIEAGEMEFPLKH